MFTKALIVLIFMYVNFFLVKVVYGEGLKEVYKFLDQTFPDQVWSKFLIKILLFIVYAIVYLIFNILFLAQYKDKF